MLYHDLKGGGNVTGIPQDLHLRRGGTSVILHVGGNTGVYVGYWGADLGELTPRDCALFRLASIPATYNSDSDIPVVLSLVPQQSEGWIGTPGLVGSHLGKRQFSQFETKALSVEANGTDGAASQVEVSLWDVEAHLELVVTVELTQSGLLRTQATLTNESDTPYDLESLLIALPTPATESRVIDQTGHHLRERDIQTHEFTIGVHERALRIARGHSTSTIHGTCSAFTGWESGMVHYIHVGWSGNSRTIAERTHQGSQCLMGGELLMPGEVQLDHGETYQTPWIYGTWGNGLDEASARFHQYLRALSHHPTKPRPVTLNAWEAVYFDHSLPRLLELVDEAARVGVERFVLDDGWFGSRRDDTSGLGDWQISPDVWPDGLNPLADAVHAHGMEFGLWFEPEMINPDSEAARAHPDWVLSPASHRPRAARNQQVLDLANPEAFEYIKSAMLTVLDSVQVDYIKWDFNRDLNEATSPRTGRPAYHAQTLATYALMDVLLAAHPDLEIESCAGGGGRIDLGIMERAVRVWGSDCIDPIERQLIEAGTALLLPPELVGSHVASTTSHTTGRTLSLTLRASTALFSHMGIEWDLTEATPQERDELAAWVSLHKELRHLLHTGRVVHADHPDRGWWIHGVVSISGDRAVYALTRLTTSAQRPTPPLCLPGLHPHSRYEIRELLPESVASEVRMNSHVLPPWWGKPITLPSEVLANAGFRFPDLDPERTILLELTRTTNK